VKDSPKDFRARNGVDGLASLAGVDGLGIRDGICCRSGVLRPSSALATDFKEGTLGMFVFGPAAFPTVTAEWLLDGVAPRELAQADGAC